MSVLNNAIIVFSIWFNWERTASVSAVEPAFKLPHRGCYYASWSTFRTGKARFLPRHMDPSLCTIVYYAFGDIHLDTGAVNSKNSPSVTSKPTFGFLTKAGASAYLNASLTVSDSAKELRFLRRYNPDVKLMLSIGGWGAGENIAAIAASSDLRQLFINSTISAVRSINYDGVDIGWEYPAKKDLAAATSLFNEFRTAIDAEAIRSGNTRLIFSAALCNTSIAGYNLPAMIKTLDLFNLMAYDLYTPAFQPTETGHDSQLFPPSGSSALNVRDFVEAWEKTGVPRGKILVGLALYGDTWNLKSPDKTGLAAPANGHGPAGPYTQWPGMLAYFEICEKIRSGELIVTSPTDIKTPYGYSASKTWWVSFEDESSIKQKVQWVISKGYGGVFVWDLSLDDFFGNCGTKFPLLNAIKSQYNIS